MSMDYPSSGFVFTKKKFKSTHTEFTHSHILCNFNYFNRKMGFTKHAIVEPMNTYLTIPSPFIVIHNVS
jgi:hypothetical protein